MNRQGQVMIEPIKGSEGKGFFVKDGDQFTMARYTVVEMNPNIKSAIIRVKFMKAEKKDTMKQTISEITRHIMRGGAIFKLNIIVPHGTLTEPFTVLGFTLEGLLVNNSYQDSAISSEYLFGTDATRFQTVRDFKLITLEGRKVTLRLTTPEDAEDFLDYYRTNREYLKPFEPKREEDFYTLYGQKKALEEMYRAYLNGLAINFGIHLDDKLIGKVQLSSLLYGSFRSTILGYGLSQEYEGQGYMQDALSTVLKYVFGELGLHRVEASTLVDNLRSQKTLELQGFQKVGLNEKYLFIAGEWRDHYTFSLVKERYVEERPERKKWR